jgi:hypothetical protein
MDHHAVAAGPFGKVECRIGLSLHVLCGHEFTVFHQYRYSDADSDPGTDAGGRIWKRRSFYSASNSLSNQPGLLFIGAWEKDEKFFASVPGDLVSLVSHAALNDAGNFHQATVALGMPAIIVEALEVIDIAHQHRRAARSFKVLVPEMMERFHHRTPVGDTGQRIGPRQQLQLGIGVSKLREASSIS